MWASAGQGPSLISPNSASRMVALRFTTLSARDHHRRNSRKKKNIKSARVRALTGSVPRTMAEARQIVSALIRNRTHVARLSAARLNHYVIGSYRLLKKNGCMFRRIS